MNNSSNNNNTSDAGGGGSFPSANVTSSSFGGTGSAFSAPGSTATSNNSCCLTDEGSRCNRVAGNACYSKRIQKTVQQKKLALTIDSTARHIHICDYHKGMIQSVRVKRKRDTLDEDLGCEEESLVDEDLPQVDLSNLQVNTLRRYKRNYRVQTKPGINKQQLAESLMKHFRTLPIIEKEAITYFLYMVKTNKNKLDQMKGLVGHASHHTSSHMIGSNSDQLC